MARNLGSDVRLVNCLGDDSHGPLYRQRFADMGIDTSHLHTAVGHNSGAAPIWVEGDGTNRIIIVPGANHQLTPEQAVAGVESVAAGDIVVGQLENLQHVTAAAFAAAKQKGATTVLNPAPAARLEPALLASSDWCIPNESEFALLAAGAPSDEPPTDDAILAFARTVSARLLVTLGAAGVALVTGDKVVRLPPPPTSNVVDTTGAGDAFVGAFAHGLASGKGELDAIRLGMACASDSVTREGTQTAFPTAERCKDLL